LHVTGTSYRGRFCALDSTRNVAVEGTRGQAAPILTLQTAAGNSVLPLN
jgi:hypothetical protein